RGPTLGPRDASRRQDVGGERRREAEPDQGLDEPAPAQMAGLGGGDHLTQLVLVHGVLLSSIPRPSARGPGASRPLRVFTLSDRVRWPPVGRSTATGQPIIESPRAQDGHAAEAAIGLAWSRSRRSSVVLAAQVSAACRWVVHRPRLGRLRY